MLLDQEVCKFKLKATALQKPYKWLGFTFITLLYINEDNGGIRSKALKILNLRLSRSQYDTALPYLQALSHATLQPQSWEKKKTKKQLYFSLSNISWFLLPNGVCTCHSFSLQLILWSLLLPPNSLHFRSKIHLFLRKVG